MKFLLSSCCAALLCLVPCAYGQKVIGNVYATDATVKGSVELSGGGTHLLSGSSVTAGDATALVRLARGGEVRVCSNTTISVASSPSGRDLLLAMGSGAIETHYALGASADSLLTPDFRIQMPGPGTFHLAVASDAHGNTCVHSLSLNSAAVIVNELMGDGSYQVKPGERVRFPHGSLAAASVDDGECGCPAPPPPVIRTEAPAPPETRTVEKALVSQATTPAEAAMAAPPPPDPSGVHVTMDAPFVFNASGPPPPRIPDPPPMQRRNLATVPVVPQPGVAPPPAITAAQASPEKKKSEKRGFFGRLRGFFASVFHG
jgi:hypothetical protein